MTKTSVGGVRMVRRVSVLLVLLLPITTCTRWQRVYYGVEYSNDGSRLQVASPGSCGCVTLQNRSHERLTLYASLHDGVAGSVVLKPSEMVRVRYDWAGPLGDDFYEIVAVRATPGAPTLATPLRDYLAAEGVADTPCDGQSCDYGALSMNKAAVQRAGDQETQALVQGVGFTKGDEVLEVSAPRGQCGCMLLRNTSDLPVILRSALRGRVVGGLTLRQRLPRPVASGQTPQNGLLSGPPGPQADPYEYEDRYIGFDWAGDLNQDVYEITSLAPPGQLDEPDSRGTSTSAEAGVPGPPLAGGAATRTPGSEEARVRSTAVIESSDRALRIKDYVRLVGRMDGMQCAPRISREVRAQKAKEFLQRYQTAFPDFDIVLLQRMAD